MAGWVNNKPVKLDGIRFKSGIEAEMWKYLKMLKIKAAYEPKSYVLLKSFRFDGHKYANITYTPDFVGKDLTGREFIIECKGFENDAFTLRRKLFLDTLRKKRSKARYFIARNRQEMADCLEMLQGKEPKKKRNMTTTKTNRKTNLLLLFLILCMLLFLYNEMKGLEQWRWRVGREYVSIKPMHFERGLYGWIDIGIGWRLKPTWIQSWNPTVWEVINDMLHGYWYPAYVDIWNEKGKYLGNNNYGCCDSEEYKPGSIIDRLKVRVLEMEDPEYVRRIK